MDNEAAVGAMDKDAKAVDDTVPEDASREWAVPVEVRGVKRTAAVPLAPVVAAQERDAVPHAVT